MNKAYIKYGFPLSLLFVIGCLAINEKVAFFVHWNDIYGFGIDPKACYYLSMFYLAIVTCFTSYFFYLKLDEDEKEDHVHTGYFILSFLLGLPVICLAIVGPLAHPLIAASILVSVLWSANKLYHVWAVSKDTDKDK